MQKPGRIERTALGVTHWVGSPASVFVHTVIFVACFVAAFEGFIPFDRMLLILTTLVSLEAIYLAIFIQMSINHTTQSLEEVEKDIGEIQEDIGEMQEDVEEIQEDVEDIEESDEADETRKTEQRQALAQIQNDLRRLSDAISRLQK